MTREIFLKRWRRTLPTLGVLSMLCSPSWATAEKGTTEDGTVESTREVVTRFARSGACYDPSFSADGKTLAFTWNITGTGQVWTVDTDGAWPRLLTQLEGGAGPVNWSPTGEWIAFSLTPLGSNNQQIYLIRPDGTGLHRITGEVDASNWLGTWSPDGRYVGLTSNRRAAAAMDPYVYDLKTKELRRISQVDDGVSDLVHFTQDGSKALLWRMANRGDDDIYLIDVASGKQTHLTPHVPPAIFESARFSPDGGTVYMHSGKGREHIGFARVRLGPDGEPGQIEIIASRDNADLQGFEITHRGDRAVLSWNVAGRNELELLDLETLEMRPGPEVPAEQAYNLIISKDDRLLGLGSMGAVMPPNIFVHRFGTEGFRQVTHSHHTGIDLDQLVRPELIFYKGHDGLDLSAWFYRPREGKAPFPTVVILHGGPEEQERPFFLPTYQALVARGIAVVAPNVRGSTGFGKTFATLDDGPLRVDAIMDVKSTVDAAVAQGFSDPARLGAFGFSYGGYLTMASTVEYPDLFSAAVSLSGIVNFITFFEHTEAWMASISKKEYGDPETQSEMLKNLSPIYRIDRLRTPTLLVHGEIDTNVPVVQAKQMATNLEERGVPVKLVLFPDEGHGLTEMENRITYAVELVKWFEHYLKAGGRSRADKDHVRPKHD